MYHDFLGREIEDLEGDNMLQDMRDNIDMDNEFTVGSIVHLLPITHDEFDRPVTPTPLPVTVLRIGNSSMSFDYEVQTESGNTFQVRLSELVEGSEPEEVVQVVCRECSQASSVSTFDFTYKTNTLPCGHAMVFAVATDTIDFAQAHEEYGLYGTRIVDVDNSEDYQQKHTYVCKVCGYTFETTVDDIAARYERFFMPCGHEWKHLQETSFPATLPDGSLPRSTDEWFNATCIYDFVGCSPLLPFDYKHYVYTGNDVQGEHSFNFSF